ncbi:hypothetical protein [Membranihabitans marinus]|uniref:hypothetical protein n=1 Tax=Membranihabitans marinus TaxID=1227546 RepID=UPI001F269713|nr:hypothetical protein [Membranihabitans marinus]
MTLNAKLTILFALGGIIGFVILEYLESNLGLILLFPCAVGLMLTYIFKKEINIYGHKRKRRNLGQKEREYLENNFPLIHFIPENKRSLFYQQVSLFKVDKEFLPQGMDKTPYQAILLCGAYAAFFENNKNEYQIPLSNILVYIFYNHPFPSPKYEQLLHISETHLEDGAMMYSIPHLIKGNNEPLRYFNIALYETAKVVEFPSLESNHLPSLSQLCQIGGYTPERLEKYIGLPQSEIDLIALSIVIYYTKNQALGSQFPELKEKLDGQLIQI